MAVDFAALLDIKILHDVNLTLWGSGVLRRIMAALNRADDAIFDRLTLAVANNPGSGTAAYLESMLESARALNASAYTQAHAMTGGELLALAAVEADWHQRAYTPSAAPIAPGAQAAGALVGVTGNQAYASAMSRPFQGALLKEVFPELGEARMRRLRAAVRTGYLAGSTTAEIVRGLRGTKAVGYKDAVIEVDRAHLETVVRTAISHTAATARDLFFEQNTELIKSQLWVSTLDGHTSTGCIVRSGKRYTVGDNPKPIGHAVPWCGGGGCGPGRLHWNCRSTAVGLLQGQESLFGTRAQAGGQVDANTTYGEWLKSQPHFVQDEVMGVKRAKLFRGGGLEIERFSTNKGRWIDLEELRARDAEAFRRAGL